MKDGRRTVAATLFALAAVLPCAPAAATQTRTILSSSMDLAQGFPEGVRVSSDGVFRPGVAFAKAADLSGTPLCVLRQGDTFWVGTGPSGDLLKVQGGKAIVAFHFQEPLVTALASSADGSLLVGTSTPAKVYRFNTATSKADVVAELKADFTWALLPDGKGFLAATGSPGRLLQVLTGAEPKVLLDGQAQHVRCLLRQGGELWAGTSSPASLYRMDPSGAFLAASLKQEEVVGLASSGDALIAAVNEKAGQGPTGPKDGKPQGGSALMILRPGRAPEEVETFNAPVTGFAADGDACWAGLADGRLFACRSRAVDFEGRWDGSALLPCAGDHSPAVLTAGPGALYLPSAGSALAFLSPAVDCGAPSLLGRAEVAGTGAKLQVRAGNSAKPSEFWSGWVAADQAQSLPPSQYAQWKLLLDPAGTARLVSLAYRPANRPPVFEGGKVCAPGEVYVRMPSQLGDHLVREVHEKDSVFPGLAQGPAQDSPPQTYFLQGFRMVSWKVEDPDGDDVTVKVEIRPEGSRSWLTLASRVTDPYYVFDARTLPGGRYAVRLTADDGPSNQEGDASSAVLDLPVFEIDNEAPRVVLTPAGPGKLTVTATDNSSVQAVRASVDGEPWRVVAPLSGAPGAARVECRVDYPAEGVHWIAVQAVDPYRNEATVGTILGAAKP